MDKIVVGFSKPKKWKPFAWLIMTGYGIPYDHVFISYYSHHYDLRVVFQASQLMVNYMSEETFLKNNEIVSEFPVEIGEAQKLPMQRFMMGAAGAPYGIKEALGLSLVRICQLIRIKITNPFPGDGREYVCSTITATLLQNFQGVKFSGDVDDLSPLDIYNLVSKFPITN